MRILNTEGMRRALRVALGATMLVMSGAAGLADDFPSKPIRLYAPSAGGSGDWAARVLASGIEKELGQRVIVENKPNLVGIELTADAKPDGYTLLFYGSGLWMYPLMQPGQAKYDPVKSFQPISLIATSPSIVAVHPSLGVKSVQELLALIKAQPGKINYSAGQVGSANHLAAELFKSMGGGLDMVYVAYKGTGEAITSTVAGETQVAFATVDVAAPFIASGKLIPLAVLSDERSSIVPNLPTVAESGIPGFEASTKQVLWAPAGLPEPVLAKLNAATVQFLNSAEAQKLYGDRGMDTTASSPKQVTEKMTAELAKWGKILKEHPDIGGRPN
jgi:tripartite-type tricarboxylate transporter receptor subunit TctC